MKRSYLATAMSVLLTAGANSNATIKGGGFFTTGQAPSCQCTTGKTTGGSTSGKTTGHESTGKTTGNPTTGNASTGHVTTGNPTTGNASTGNVTTGNPTTGTFTTGNPTTGTSTTGNVTTGNVTTGNVTTGTPTTGTFTTGNQTTGAPTTGDLTTTTTGGPNTTGITGDVTTTTTGIPSTTTSTTGTPVTTGDLTTTTTGGPNTTGVTGDVTTTTSTTGTPVTTGDQSTTTTTSTTGTPATTGDQSTTTSTTGTPATTGDQSATTTTGTTTDDQGTTTTGDGGGGDGGGEEVVVTPAPAKGERELKSKLEPFFYIDFDWGSWIVNLTPHEASKKAPQYVKTDFNPKNDTLVYGDFKDGFQKTTFSNIEGGLGIKSSFWYANATGVLAQFWAYVGAMPVVGRETESVRYAKTMAEAATLEGYKKVPFQAEELLPWAQGDHMTYVSKGGVMFAASMGLGIFNVGSAALAQGTWETYIEKVEADTVYVKMTKGDISNYSAFTGALLVNLSVSNFKDVDDGFSFLFNLKTEVGRKAYEDMIRGNVLASTLISSSIPENMVEVPPVLKVETFKTLTTGKMVSRMFGLPIIWNASYSKGNIESFTTSEFHLDHSRAEVNYGIFSREKNYRFWNKHSETDFMFYGARYNIVNNYDNSKTQGMFGRYSYAYKNEVSNNNKLRVAINKLVKITGIDDLKVNIPTMDLAYTGLEFDTTLSEENTRRLMDIANRRGEDFFLKMGDKYVVNYAQNNGDVYGYCLSAESDIKNIKTGCTYNLRQTTSNAMSAIYKSLTEMNRTQVSDAKAFSAAYGKLGEAMGENLFTFRAVLEIAGPGVLVEYLIEGTKFSLFYKAWTTTDIPNRWELTSDPRLNADTNNIPFEPRLRRSKSRGFIVSPGTGPIQMPGMSGIANGF